MAAIIKKQLLIRFDVELLPISSVHASAESFACVLAGGNGEPAAPKETSFRGLRTESKCGKALIAQQITNRSALEFGEEKNTYFDS